MKIIAWWQGKERHIYKNLEEASKKTLVSQKRILYCIKTGFHWRCWLFDYF